MTTHPTIVALRAQAKINPAEFIGHSLTTILRSANSLIDQAESYYEKLDLETAFILYNKVINLYLDVIKKHADFKSRASTSDVVAFTERIKKVEKDVLDIRTRIEKRLPRTGNKVAPSNGIIKNAADLDFLSKPSTSTGISTSANANSTSLAASNRIQHTTSAISGATATPGNIITKPVQSHPQVQSQSYSQSQTPASTSTETPSQQHKSITSPIDKRRATIPIPKVKSYLDRQDVSILFIDVRPSIEYYKGHIRWCVKESLVGKTLGGTINIDPSILFDGVTCDQIIAALESKEHTKPFAEIFRNRAFYNLVVYYDNNTKTLPNTNSTSPLKYLNEAMWIREFRNAKMPTLLEGGFEAFTRYLRDECKLGEQDKYIEAGGGVGTLVVEDGTKRNVSDGVARMTDEYLMNKLSSLAIHTSKSSSSTNVVRSETGNAVIGARSESIPKSDQNGKPTITSPPPSVDISLTPTKSLFDEMEYSFRMMTPSSSRIFHTTDTTTTVHTTSTTESSKLYPTTTSIPTSTSSSGLSSYPTIPPIKPSLSNHELSTGTQPLVPLPGTGSVSKSLGTHTPTPTHTSTYTPASTSGNAGVPPARSSSLSSLTGPITQPPGGSITNNNLSSLPPLPPQPVHPSQYPVSSHPPSQYHHIPQQPIIPSQQQPPRSISLAPPSSNSITNLSNYVPSLPPKTINTTFSVSSRPTSALHDEPGPLKGLRNLGNTCFLNSTLQCLSGTIPLTRYFNSGEYKRFVNRLNPMGTKGVVAEAFANIIRNMWMKEESVINPALFKESICVYAPQFKGTDQHDSQEFLGFLLDGLHEDLNIARRGPSVKEHEKEEDEEMIPDPILSQKYWNKYLKLNSSFIVELFQGQLKSKLACTVCGKTSTTFNPFMYLSLPIPTKRSTPITLYDCLDTFVEPEILQGNDAWLCPRCKVARKSTKLLTLAKMPKILLIHLKRFYYSGPFRNKIETNIDFPVRGLDVTNYIPPDLRRMGTPFFQNASGTNVSYTSSSSSPNFVYDLYAVSNHYGGLNGGHYTSSVYHGVKGSWFYFDDTRVSAISENEVKSKAAYILFYIRRDT